MDEPDRKIHTETDIMAYEGYMPGDWGEKTIKPIPVGTVLEHLLLDLAMSWRSTSYTAQMPVTSIQSNPRKITSPTNLERIVISKESYATF
jgi:hypothetical protein